ncbi:MAG TPA: glycogen debranching N-terminal domain-containing protein [Acidimicrobiales bacterium]|nr:glycogen debranching N-terminal domain-containing protein [Acidimicrobiales bacterium]
MIDASPYEGTTPVASLGASDGTVTLVEGQTFALSGRTGDMREDLPNGLFVLDTRVLSRWELRVNGHQLEPLAVELETPFAARFAARSAPETGHADASLVVFRERFVGLGMREDVRITNHGADPVALLVELRCDTDFADLFEVKESRVRRRGRHSHEIEPARMRFGHRADAVDKEVHVSFDRDATVEPGVASWHETLAPGERWEVRISVTLAVGGALVEPEFPTIDGAVPPAARRLEEWEENLPVIRSDHAGLTETLRRSSVDLGALRIFDPDHPDLPILAAGAPWFMTVFGRDSLLTAWMTLLADSSLAHGVLETLARFQGDDVDPSTEEEPGKILHEMRFGDAGGLALGGGSVYYGTADATPLFVMLLGELRRWNPDDQLVGRLLPHADRALDWIEHFGDRDGDGYVEYQRSDERGLANQGWKDSWDAIRFADGRFAEPPIALAEVQGYVYAAYVARAHFAQEAGDDDAFARWSEKASTLRRRFNEDFWLESEGTYALALDRDKRPVDSVCSNAGHCLWTGIVDPERAGSVADRLLAPDSFTGFGIRTMASSMAAYNPVSYHNGSVWPHDNALCIAGLTRYGFTEHAHRVIEAQLSAAEQQGGALPELFAGFGTDELSIPAVYPTSCSPQAWAAAAPLLWLRSLLRLDPWAARGQLWLDPSLPASIRRLHVDGIRIAGRTIGIGVDDGRVQVDGAEGLEVLHRPRPPMSTTLAGTTPA